ncbi:hypothetical protein BKA67DRAFT_535522 [Truncatella angustata]|uniref:Uncharacterized protein n=1 Tax=Truncatella angustata TaxID=152316 RepID=A0A9P8UL97_9PEZI|nr:uncharacterized protein BKA67DRAFT_535522 [Truncatella angustata]KAH6654189.1 hypothetical protein BKA67DRAFT_535522 [Truncatella angustata]
MCKTFNGWRLRPERATATGAEPLLAQADGVISIGGHYQPGSLRLAAPTGGNLARPDFRVPVQRFDFLGIVPLRIGSSGGPHVDSGHANPIHISKTSPVERIEQRCPLSQGASETLANNPKAQTSRKNPREYCPCREQRIEYHVLPWAQGQTDLTTKKNPAGRIVDARLPKAGTSPKDEMHWKLGMEICLSVKNPKGTKLESVSRDARVICKMREENSKKEVRQYLNQVRDNPGTLGLKYFPGPRNC